MPPAKSLARIAATPRSKGGDGAAPRPLARGHAAGVALAQMRKALSEMRRQIENHCDYVGPRFAEEARRIHYGETDPRGIYGEATDDEFARTGR